MILPIKPKGVSNPIFIHPKYEAQTCGKLKVGKMNIGSLGSLRRG